MNHKKLEKEIRLQLSRASIPPMQQKREEELFTAIRQEIYHKTIYPRKSWLQKMVEQLLYLSPSVWMIQGAILVIAALLAIDRQVTGWFQVVSVLISLVGLAGIPELAKSFYSGMWELEESCRYNLRQLLVIRLVLLGMVDVFMLVCFLALAGWQNNTSTEIIIYLMIPFNLSNSIYLLVFRYLRGKCSLFFMAAVGLLQAFAMVFLSAAIHSFAGEASQAVPLRLVNGGGIASFFLLCFCIYQLIYAVNKEETKAWNCGQTV